MLKAFKNHINQQLSFLKESKLLIAISGGVDSVVLTHLCKEAKLEFALAHCNFNLRGNESDADESFVLELAEDLNVEVFIQNFDTESFAKNEKLSIQLAARQLRYDWFFELSEQLNFDYILTAHHADDNLETFLINLSRGTGLEGLKGIPEVNQNIVRPLLSFSREDIEDYAKKHHLKWREDSSNASTKYLRNKLRHDVIPTLKNINPDVLSNFQNTLAHLNDSSTIVEDAVDSFLNKAIVSIDNSQISYKISEFEVLNNPKAYLFEIFKDYGFTQWKDIENLLTAQSGKLVFSKTHQLLKDRDCLILSELTTAENNETVTILEDQNEIKLPNGILYIESVKEIVETDKSTIYIDKKTLKYPLTVRHWEKGDYFYPLGMQGKKKLSKFFKDEKLSLLDKQKTLLLCSDHQVVWVINHRADNRFKLTKQTQDILKIKYQK
ncbi:tRNA lysidine(34) synthetase TilS [Mesoflavibacter sp. SCSIO 43206]|uniref:tRNA lysidine(34) synthetase TilS n=1 Tax=Mesoflavibacter sp. SCSIO 43206 TaxID=2779362 RepID=UPI001CA7D462|nr:tRNA lysidine(34) synthetase TilS [Mesoflavibacter sp. SCSIO 43206]UAB75322.1 tRNA lysidine(34) synthetase TilS [Mesoflavibacter sp. SCSIO 43206]